MRQVLSNLNLVCTRENTGELGRSRTEHTCFLEADGDHDQTLDLRFRLSSHSSPVETSRHHRPPIPLDFACLCSQPCHSRLCLRCSQSSVGDEYDALLVKSYPRTVSNAQTLSKRSSDIHQASVDQARLSGQTAGKARLTSDQGCAQNSTLTSRGIHSLVFCTISNTKVGSLAPTRIVNWSRCQARRVCSGFTLVCVKLLVCASVEQAIMLATASADQMVCIWWAPCMRMQCLAELPGHTDQVCGNMLNASFSHSVAIFSRP